MNTLVIVRGLPGAGKTTFAHALNVQKYGGKALVVAADDFMVNDEGEYDYDRERLSHVHSRCQIAAGEALAERRDVIVHNTFTRPSEFNPYLKMVKPTQKVLIFDLFDAGLTDEQLTARNVHDVPLASVTKMRARYSPPPQPQIPVHVEGDYAYWQFPEADWLILKE